MATTFGVLAIFLWGALALLGNLTKSIPAFQLLFMCFAVSFLLLFIKRVLTKQPLFTPPSLSKTQTIIGIIGLFGFHFCYFMALKYAPLIELAINTPSSNGHKYTIRLTSISGAYFNAIK